MIDGQRWTDNELASSSWLSIPIDSIERIEIIRGSASVLYGSGATDGVINVITTRPKPGAREARLALGLSNYDTRDWRASGTLARDRLGLTTVFYRFDCDNYPDNHEIRQTGVNVGLDTLQPGARLSLRVSAERQDLRLPGARNRAQRERDGSGAATPIVPVGGGEFRTDLSYRHRDRTSF